MDMIQSYHRESRIVYVYVICISIWYGMVWNSIHIRIVYTVVRERMLCSGERESEKIYMMICCVVEKERVRRYI